MRNSLTMGIFRFKHFVVRNERSAMKVNTDGVLLGAATEVSPSDKRVLDIGTGTGTVALMIAQRMASVCLEDWNIQGIDIDPPSAEEASENFGNSPWGSHLEAMNMGLRDFSMKSMDEKYDLIVSNPPYYDNSLQAPSARRNAARHVGDPENPQGSEPLSYREILEYASVALTDQGRLSVILPSDQEKHLLRYARMCGMLPWRLLRIKTVERKSVSRLIVQFKRREAMAGTSVKEETLTLLNEGGKRTSQHASLITDYYL